MTAMTDAERKRLQRQRKRAGDDPVRAFLLAVVEDAGRARDEGLADGAMVSAAQEAQRLLSEGATGPMSLSDIIIEQGLGLSPEEQDERFARWLTAQPGQAAVRQPPITAQALANLAWAEGIRAAGFETTRARLTYKGATRAGIKAAKVLLAAHSRPRASRLYRDHRDAQTAWGLLSVFEQTGGVR